MLMICKNTTVVSAFFVGGVGLIGLAAYNKSDTFVLFVFFNNKFVFSVKSRHFCLVYYFNGAVQVPVEE